MRVAIGLAILVLSVCNLMAFTGMALGLPQPNHDALMTWYWFVSIQCILSIVMLVVRPTWVVK